MYIIYVQELLKISHPRVYIFFLKISPKEARELRSKGKEEGEEYVRNLLKTLNVNTDIIPDTRPTEESGLQEMTNS